MVKICKKLAIRPVTLLISIGLILTFNACKPPKTSDSDLSSIRRIEGKKAFDLGIYIDNSPTTMQGELVPKEIGFQRTRGG